MHVGAACFLVAARAGPIPISSTLTIRSATAEGLGTRDRFFQRRHMTLLKNGYSPSRRVGAVPIIGRAHPYQLRSGQFFVADGWSVEPQAAGSVPAAWGMGAMLR
jgi:hypothetical protein